MNIIDDNVSATASAATLPTDKQSLQVNVVDEELSLNADKATSPSAGASATGSNKSSAADSGNDSATESNVSIHTNTKGAVSQQALDALNIIATGEEGEDEEEGMILPMSHFDPSRQNTNATIANVENENVFHDDDVSSLQHSIGFKVDNPQKKLNQSTGNVAPIQEETEYYEEVHQQTLQRRNILIIITLLVFIGVVAGIGAGVGIALKNKNSTGNGGKDSDTSGATDGANDDTGDSNQDTTSGSTSDGSEIPSFPTASPVVQGPPICLELGIVFDEYAIETGWKLINGVYNQTVDTFIDPKDVVWESKFYSAQTYNNKAGVFRKCFTSGTYTFIFTDTEGDGICCYHGEGLYVLSSEGSVIAQGGEMNSQVESVVFDLEYKEPAPVDTDGDGLDDRLGLIMPYNSSGLVEGVNCENFHLEINTDKSGLETTWELYEGGDNSGDLIANGGSYGSEATYIIDYCLASTQEYTFYIYDWAQDGLCCASGKGSYSILSGEEVIRNSDGKFGAVESTKFTLPINPYPTAAPSVSRFPTISPTVPDVSSSFAFISVLCFLSGGV